MTSHRHVHHFVRRMGRGTAPQIFRMHDGSHGPVRIHERRIAGRGIFKVLQPSLLPAPAYATTMPRITKGSSRALERFAGISGTTGGKFGMGFAAIHHNSRHTFGPYGSVSGAGLTDLGKRFGHFGSLHGNGAHSAHRKKHAAQSRLTSLLRGLRV